MGKFLSTIAKQSLNQKANKLEGKLQQLADGKIKGKEVVRPLSDFIAGESDSELSGKKKEEANHQASQPSQQSTTDAAGVSSILQNHDNMVNFVLNGGSMQSHGYSHMVLKDYGRLDEEIRKKSNDPGMSMEEALGFSMRLLDAVLTSRSAAKQTGGGSGSGFGGGSGDLIIDNSKTQNMILDINGGKLTHDRGKDRIIEDKTELVDKNLLAQKAGLAGGVVGAGGGIASMVSNAVDAANARKWQEKIAKIGHEDEDVDKEELDKEKKKLAKVSEKNKGRNLDDTEIKDDDNNEGTIYLNNGKVSKDLEDVLSSENIEPADKAKARKAASKKEPLSRMIAQMNASRAIALKMLSTNAGLVTPNNQHWESTFRKNIANFHRDYIKTGFMPDAKDFNKSNYLTWYGQDFENKLEGGKNEQEEPEEILGEWESVEEEVEVEEEEGGEGEGAGEEVGEGGEGGEGGGEGGEGAGASGSGENQDQKEGDDGAANDAAQRTSFDDASRWERAEDYFKNKLGVPLNTDAEKNCLKVFIAKNPVAIRAKQDPAMDRLLQEADARFRGKSEEEKSKNPYNGEPTPLESLLFQALNWKSPSTGDPKAGADAKNEDGGDNQNQDVNNENICFDYRTFSGMQGLYDLYRSKGGSKRSECPDVFEFAHQIFNKESEVRKFLDVQPWFIKNQQNFFKTVLPGLRKIDPRNNTTDLREFYFRYNYLAHNSSEDQNNSENPDKLVLAENRGASQPKIEAGMDFNTFTRCVLDRWEMAQNSDWFSAANVVKEGEQREVPEEEKILANDQEGEQSGENGKKMTENKASRILGGRIKKIKIVYIKRPDEWLHVLVRLEEVLEGCIQDKKEYFGIPSDTLNSLWPRVQKAIKKAKKEAEDKRRTPMEKAMVELAALQGAFYKVRTALENEDPELDREKAFRDLKDLYLSLEATTPATILKREVANQNSKDEGARKEFVDAQTYCRKRDELQDEITSALETYSKNSEQMLKQLEEAKKLLNSDEVQEQLREEEKEGKDKKGDGESSSHKENVDKVKDILDNKKEEGKAGEDEAKELIDEAKKEKDDQKKQGEGEQKQGPDQKGLDESSVSEEPVDKDQDQQKKENPADDGASEDNSANDGNQGADNVEVKKPTVQDCRDKLKSAREMMTEDLEEMNKGTLSKNAEMYRFPQEKNRGAQIGYQNIALVGPGLSQHGTRFKQDPKLYKKLEAEENGSEPKQEKGANGGKKVKKKMKKVVKKEQKADAKGNRTSQRFYGHLIKYYETGIERMRKSTQEDVVQMNEDAVSPKLSFTKDPSTLIKKADELGRKEKEYMIIKEMAKEAEKDAGKEKKNSGGGGGSKPLSPAEFQQQLKAARENKKEGTATKEYFVQGKDGQQRKSTQQEVNSILKKRKSKKDRVAALEKQLGAQFSAKMSEVQNKMKINAADQAGTYFVGLQEQTMKKESRQTINIPMLQSIVPNGGGEGGGKGQK